MKAEEIMAGAGEEPVTNQGRQATAAGGESAVATAASTTNNDFRPHMNLKPNYLEKGALHQEVKTFCQMVDAYIRTGYGAHLHRMSGSI